jgi:hypothetical protein
MRELVLGLTEDPEWLPSVSEVITDAIHAELDDVNTDPDLRFRRWCAKAHETITGPHELTEAVELGADWTFDYVETLSDGLVRRYGETEIISPSRCGAMRPATGATWRWR